MNGDVVEVSKFYKKKKKEKNVLERVGSGASSIAKGTVGSGLFALESVGKELSNQYKAQQNNPEYIKLMNEKYALMGQDTDYLSMGGARTQAPQDYGQRMSNYSKKMDDLVEKTPVSSESWGSQLLRDSAKDAYETSEGLDGLAKFLVDNGLGMADYLATLAMTGGNQVASLGMMGVKSGAKQAYEATQRGANLREATLSGLATGFIEAGTEKLPLEMLTKLVKLPGKGVKGILGAGVKQGFSEGVEEGVSYLAGNALNQVILQDKADKMSMDELGQSVFGGAFSGGVMGAGGNLLGKGVDENTYRKEKNKIDPSFVGNPEANGLVKNFVTFKKYADMQQKDLIKTLQKMGDKQGFIVENPGAKSISSGVNKVMRKRADGSGYQIEDMKDHTRSAIILNSYEDVPSLMAELRKKYPDYTAEVMLDEPKNEGRYRGIHLVIDNREGVKSEIQVSTKEAWKIKKQTDEIYEKWRNADKEKLSPEQIKQRKADELESARLWNDYYSGLTPEVLRNASSSVMELESYMFPLKPSYGTNLLSVGENISADSKKPLGKANTISPKSDSEYFITAPPLITPSIFQQIENSNRINLEKAKLNQKLKNNPATNIPRKGLDPLLFNPDGTPIVETYAEREKRKAGIDTMVKNPYQGMKPKQENVPSTVYTVPDSSYDNAETLLNDYKAKEQSEQSLSGFLKKAYNLVFKNQGGDRKVTVDNVSYDGLPYEVSLNRKLVSKVISSGYLVPEKLVVMDNLDEIVKTSTFVESGNYNQMKKRANDKAIRYDYFEKLVNIKNKPYLVKFDVEVDPSQNRFRSYVINNIEVTPTTTDTGSTNPGQFADITSTDSIRNSPENINTNVSSLEGKRKSLKTDPNNPFIGDDLMPNLHRPEEAIQLEKTNKDYVKQYGAFDKGEQPRVREIQVAQETDYGKTSQFARTIAESDALTDEMAGMIEEEVANGTFAYIPESNQSKILTAENELVRRGYEYSLNSFLYNDHNDSAHIANGEVLLREAAEQKDIKAVMEISAKLSTDLTEAGRTVQAARILKKLTPGGQLTYLQKSVSKLQRDIESHYKNAPKLELNEQLVDELLQAKTTEDMQMIVDKLGADIASQMPSNWKDKVNAWRYFSMLGNPRTHVRNILGNALFYPVRTFKNVIGTGLEHGLGKLERFSDMERTKAILTNKDKNLIDFAKSDFKLVKKNLQGSGKYDINSAIANNKKVFDNNVLEKSSKGVSGLLEAEDEFFLRNAYVSSMAQYMKANNLTPEYLQSSSREAKTSLQKAQRYAQLEAEKATYRDASDLASALSRIEKQGGAKGFMLKAVIPFKKTPINILKRGIEYSPVGLIDGMSRGLYKLQNGKITGAEFVDQIASGLTGTGVVALGAWLASMGIVRGKDDDEQRKQGYDRDLGEQDYSIRLPNGASYTLDWIAPVVMPLMTGVELYNTLKAGGKGNVVQSITDGLASISEPMFETTMLQGVMSSIKTFQQNPSDIALGITGKAVENYAGQFIPTAFGQVARSIDPVRRSTYDSDKIIGQPIKKLMAKTPFLSMALEPYVDSKGQEVQQPGGNFLGRLGLNTLSPGYYKEDSSTSTDREIQRLYGVNGDTAVLPRTIPKSIILDGQSYLSTASEYTKYAKTLGQESTKIVENFVKSTYYKTLSDEEKISTIKRIYDYSSSKAKDEFFEKRGMSYDVPKSYQHATQAQNIGIPTDMFFMFNMACGQMEADKNGAGNTISGSKKKKIFGYIQSLPLTVEQKIFLAKSAGY